MPKNCNVDKGIMAETEQREVLIVRVMAFGYSI